MRTRTLLIVASLVCILLLLLAAACDRPRRTPTPTLTPVPPQPPQVIGRVPQRGQEHDVKATVIIAFDQPMAQRSVETAFVISPTVQGTFAWQGNNLLFTPADEGFARATTYRVTVSDQARSATGLALPAPFEFTFQTVGYLEITAVQPANGSRDVAPDALVTVMFNRPVVPLTALGQVPASPELLTSQSFAPPGVAGEGKWLNTSIYTFKPIEGRGFVPGTTYKLRIPAGITDTTGGVLAQDYVWEFTTELPKVTGFSCSDLEPYVGPSPTISMTFNMLMDHESVESRFSLAPQGSTQSVPGKFQWSGKTLSFTPLASLQLDTSYVVTVGAGVRASAGGEGSDQDVQWTFRTIALPRVLRTSPRNGQQDAEPYTSLEVTFSSPMKRDSLWPNLTIQPTATEVYTSWNELDTQLYISFGAKPSTTYTFTFGTNMEGLYGHKLGQPYRLTFTTKPLPPSVFFPQDRVGTYNAYTTTMVYVQHVNVSELNLALYRLDRADFILLNSGQWYERWDKFRPAERNLIRKWSTKVESKLNSYMSSFIPLSEDRKKALPPGFYYLEVKAPGVSETLRHMLVVSHANLMLKVTQSEALVWAVDLASGKGLSAWDVAVLGTDGRVLTSGRTDKNGILFGSWSSEATTSGKEMDLWAPLLAIAGPDDDPAVASTDWSSGIAPWQFDLPFDLSLMPYRAHFYTDRNIYRPGQTVYFKGVLRSDDDGRYSLPANVKSLPIIVVDNQGKEIYRADLPVSDMGTVYGEFKLAEEAGLGFYNLETQLDQQRTFGTSFQVAEYRKPEFVVTVTTDKEEYVQGDEIKVSVAANYYFGGAVANAKVSWRLMSQDYYFQWTGKGDYSFTDPDYESRGKQTAYGELVTSGTGTTDVEGHFTFKLPANIATRKNSQIFTLEASITDPSNQEVSGRSSAIVHKGQFYIGLAPQEYIGTVGHPSKVNVITVDSKSLTVPNVALTVVFLEQHWYNVQQQADDGRYYWDWKLQEIPVYTTTVTTDASGMAVTSFTPDKGGAYRVRAFGRDRRENEVRSSTYVWISSNEFISWRQENNDRIELIADKKSYQPGETARVLIPSPFPGPVQALLTIERGHILSYRLLTLTTNSEQVEIPILSEHAPNAYVSVVILKSTDQKNPVASYRVGYINLMVSTQEKELTIQITPDKFSYVPGSKATFTVRATDYQGRGVQSELSLQLVDLSVLALTDNIQGTLLDYFYRQRPLGVRTGTTLAISVDRYREQARPPTGKGGSGGPEGGGPIRRRFPDTAYWNAAVRTDAQGQAQVTVDLPDNLTTWRMTGKAITADTQVGESSTDIITTKDLLVRSVAPRFFVVGDQVQLGAVVHNNTDRPLVTDVSLQGKGIAIEQPAQKIEIPAHGNQSVNWEARVEPGESAVLTWRVSSGDLSDALELTLPVYHYSTPEVVATAGVVPAAESRTEVIYLPERLDASQGELTVQLDPSLAASMRDGLKYLEEYPYDCIEQTVSRFLPNVITYRALQKLGIRNAELEARLPQYVAVGLQRIYALQHYDGGWGWWLADDSNPFISAYVLLGMTEAARAGFAVDSQVMSRAANYLQGILDSQNVQYLSQTNVRAFILYVLAEYGQGDLGRTVALYEKRESLSNYGKAYLIMALHILQPQEPAHVKTLLSDLTNAAILSATGAHWEENKVDYWTMNTNTRTTALVLEALVRVDAQNPLIPNVVRWLMVARKEGHWETTQETAWSVVALTNFMVASGELQADYDYRVTLNAKTLKQDTVTVQNVAETRKLVVAIKDLLRDESNRLVLERLAPQGQQSGKGQLYYSAYLRYFLPVEDVVAVNRGIIVTRQYVLPDRPEQPITQANVGDVIQVKLTVIAPNDLHYLVVEDPLPAGCEALDTSLKTTSSAATGPQLTPSAPGEHSYWWYFVQSELRDEKVALFSTYLSKGTYEYTYLIRASVPGRFLTMPTNAYEMYFPEVYGRSDGVAFTITP